MEEKETNMNVNYKGIKSDYILKGIFLFLFERKKLNIISYNKDIQSKLNINIENYKKLSQRKIVGERNGKGR